MPDVVFEAARVEGAGPWATFRRVTLPNLVPSLSVLLVRDLVLSLQLTMVPTILLTKGGPDGATTTLPLLIPEEGFSAFRFGEAAAIPWCWRWSPERSPRSSSASSVGSSATGPPDALLPRRRVHWGHVADSRAVRPFS